MSGCKCKISLIIVLGSLFSIQVFSQQIDYGDSLAKYNSQKISLKPKLHYAVESTFIIVPHLGTVTGFTLSPFLSVPLSPKLSVDGGIIILHYRILILKVRSMGHLTNYLCSDQLAIR
jgi:hypothetical protein